MCDLDFYPIEQHNKVGHTIWMKVQTIVYESHRTAHRRFKKKKKIKTNCKKMNTWKNEEIWVNNKMIEFAT